MKKWLYFAVVCFLAVGSAFLGRDLSNKKHLTNVVEEILSSPQEPVAKVATVTAPQKSIPPEINTGARIDHSKSHISNEQNILQVRRVLKIKYYESIALKDSQKASYKKVFLAVATDQKADWLMQRQALRNLYKQKIQLSDEDRRLLLTKTDQRALENYKQDDKELLAEAMQSL